MKQANLTVKLKKCQFGGNTVHYLGHVVGGGQIHPDKEKVRAVCEHLRPVTKDVWLKNENGVNLQYMI